MTTTPDSVRRAFFGLHHGLPRQAPGSDATTRALLGLAGLDVQRPRVLDIGCGPGRSALLLAAEADAEVTAVDVHEPFLAELHETARRRGLHESITTRRMSMDALSFEDAAFDVLWAEGSAYVIGFDRALRLWRRLLAPGGVLVLTELEWAVSSPSSEASAFWTPRYPLRTADENIAAAETAGYRAGAHLPLPESDWWDEYYTPLSERIAAADTAVPGMAEAVAETSREIALRREHGDEYRYAGYVLHR